MYIRNLVEADRPVAGAFFRWLRCAVLMGLNPICNATSCQLKKILGVRQSHSTGFRIRAFSLVLLAALFLSPGLLWAQDADDLLSELDAASPVDDGDEDLVQELDDGEPVSSADADQLAVFVLDRGWYCTSDLGVAVTLGGVNGNSTLEPYISVKGGLDLGEDWAVQLYLMQAYASQNPISQNDIPGNGGQGTMNYGLMSFGAEGVWVYRPRPQLALQGRVGLGVSRNNPVLTSLEDPYAEISPWGPQAQAGVDLMYHTLLTDFTAGISANTFYVVMPQVLGVGGAFVVRYTF